MVSKIIKKYSAIILALLLVACGSVQTKTPAPTRGLQDHAVSLSWQQSFANNGACSAAITTSCITGFNEGYLVGAAQTQLQINTNSAAVCAGTIQPEACTANFNAVLPIGFVVFYVATTFVDQNGAAGVTAAAMSPGVQVAADHAVNVTVVVGP
jgi:hypothetical protein